MNGDAHDLFAIIRRNWTAVLALCVILAFVEYTSFAALSQVQTFHRQVCSVMTVAQQDDQRQVAYYTQAAEKAARAKDAAQAASDLHSASLYRQALRFKFPGC